MILGSTPSEPTHIVVSYYAIEGRITQAIEILQARGGQPNTAAAARGFLLPAQRLRARWNGRHQKNIQTIPGNRRLNEHQELAICQYLGCLDNIGLPTRLFMITVSSCTNSTLHFPETTSEISSSQAKGSRYRPEKRTRPRYHPPARTKLSQH